MKNTPKNIASQTKKQETYERMASFILQNLAFMSIFSYSHSRIAYYIGCSQRHVRRLYQRLREDPRFIVGNPLRRENHSYKFYTIKVKLRHSIMALVSSCASVSSGHVLQEKINNKNINLKLKHAPSDYAKASSLGHETSLQDITTLKGEGPSEESYQMLFKAWKGRPLSDQELEETDSARPPRPVGKRILKEPWEWAKYWKEKEEKQRSWAKRNNAMMERRLAKENAPKIAAQIAANEKLMIEMYGSIPF